MGGCPGASAGRQVVQRSRARRRFSRSASEALPVAPESIDPDHPVRVLSYGRKPHVHRIFFTVDDETEVVRILHVRRGPRRRPIAEELRDEQCWPPLMPKQVCSSHRHRRVPPTDEAPCRRCRDVNGADEDRCAQLSAEFRQQLHSPRDETERVAVLPRAQTTASQGSSRPSHPSFASSSVSSCLKLDRT